LKKFSCSMTDEEPVVKKAREESEAGDVKDGLNGDATKSLAELKSLENFVFKEVLGSVPEKKLIFILCHNTVEDKPGVLILDRKPLPEKEEELNEVIRGLSLVRLSDNDVYLSADASLPEKFNVSKSTVIYPATEKHITKYRFKPLHSIFESPEDYKKITLPYIQKSQFNVDWVYNILDGKREQELVFVKDDDPETGFYLMQDLKWDGKTLENLYYQAIVLRRDLKSIRDLTEKELPLLENILDKSLKAIDEKHGLPASRLKCYFHYQPTYYHLHVHIRHIGTQSDVPYVFLQSVIDNIKTFGDYYQRTTLQVFTKEGHPLYEAFKEAGRL